MWASSSLDSMQEAAAPQMVFRAQCLRQGRGTGSPPRGKKPGRSGGVPELRCRDQDPPCDRSSPSTSHRRRYRSLLPLVPAPLQLPNGPQSSCRDGVLGPGHSCCSAPCGSERSLGHLGQHSVCQAPSQRPGLLPGAAGADSEAALPIPAPQGPAVLPSCRLAVGSCWQ